MCIVHNIQVPFFHIWVLHLMHNLWQILNRNRNGVNQKTINQQKTLFYSKKKNQWLHRCYKHYLFEGFSFDLIKLKNTYTDELNTWIQETLFMPNKSSNQLNDVSTQLNPFTDIPKKDINQKAAYFFTRIPFCYPQASFYCKTYSNKPKSHYSLIL